MTGLNGALEACITSEQSRSTDPRSPNTLWDATDLDVTRDPEEWLISKPRNLNEDMCLRSTAVGLAGCAHLGCVKTDSNLEQSDPKQRDLGTGTASIASHHVGATLRALPPLHIEGKAEPTSLCLEHEAETPRRNNSASRPGALNPTKEAASPAQLGAVAELKPGSAAASGICPASGRKGGTRAPVPTQGSSSTRRLHPADSAQAAASHGGDPARTARGWHQKSRQKKKAPRRTAAGPVLGRVLQASKAEDNLALLHWSQELGLGCPCSHFHPIPDPLCTGETAQPTHRGSTRGSSPPPPPAARYFLRHQLNRNKPHVSIEPIEGVLHALFMSFFFFFPALTQMCLLTLCLIYTRGLT